MSFRIEYPYMPPGSYAVTPIGKVIFLREDLPEELKERLIKDVAEKERSRDEKMKDPYAFI